MNELNNRFLFFQTRSAYNDAIENPGISESSIVFVEDDKSIHTHGVEFNCGLQLSNVQSVVEQYISNITQQTIPSLREEIYTNFYTKDQINNFLNAQDVNAVVSLSNQTMFAQTKNGVIDSFEGQCAIQVFDDSGELYINSTEHGFTLQLGNITRSDEEPADGVIATIDNNIIMVHIENVYDAEGIYITIPFIVSVANTNRLYNITVFTVKAGMDGKDAVDLYVDTNIIHCNADVTTHYPERVIVGAKVGDIYLTVPQAEYKGYSFRYSYDNDENWHDLHKRVLNINGGSYNSRHNVITIQMIKDGEIYDSHTIHYVYDGQSIQGADAVNYHMDAVHNNIIVKQGVITGSVGFKLYKSVGSVNSEITQLSDIYDEDIQELYVEVNGVHITENILYDPGKQCWVIDNIQSTYSGDNPYTLVQFRISDSVVASIIIPFIISGEDGRDADVSPQALMGAVSRIWGTYDPETTYYNGTSGEDGVKYLDIVRMPDGNYYRLASTIAESTGNDYTAEDENSIPMWIRFEKSPDTWIQNLITDSVLANTFTSHQVIITSQNNDVVAGMISGDNVPEEISTDQVSNEEKVRIFAGYIPPNGDIVDTAFNVTSTGRIKASSGKVMFDADGSGYIANGNIVWNEDGDIYAKDIITYGDTTQLVIDNTNINTCVNNIIIKDVIADFRNSTQTTWTYNISGNVYKEGALISTFAMPINLYTLVLMCNYWNYYSNAEVNPTIADLLLQAIISNIDDIYLYNKSRFSENSQIHIDIPLLQVGYGSVFTDRFVSRDTVTSCIISQLNLSDQVNGGITSESSMYIPNKRPIEVYYSQSESEPAVPVYSNTIGWYEGLAENQFEPVGNDIVWRRYIKNPTYCAYRIIDTTSPNGEYGEWTMIDFSQINPIYNPVTPGDGIEKQLFPIDTINNKQDRYESYQIGNPIYDLNQKVEAYKYSADINYDRQ